MSFGTSDPVVSELGGLSECRILSYPESGAPGRSFGSCLDTDIRVVWISNRISNRLKHRRLLKGFYFIEVIYY